ncbi:MAG: UDP-N-acetylmuramoyl-L-alanyl-D-glutamate--2,6-diaminopimelate ligase [Patescibacteria group bacterium]
MCHWLFGFAAAAVCRFPSRKMIVIGVTGTNGKSTVVELIHAILSSFGLNAAAGSSVRWWIKDQAENNASGLSMAGGWRLQKFLRRAVLAGCQYAVLEVSSQGLVQRRDAGVNFDVAVITNLRPEHIESHGSFEKYRAAKAKLFKKLCFRKGGVKKINVVNLDDPSAFYYTNFKAAEHWGYGLFEVNKRSGLECIVPQSIKFLSDGTAFELDGERYESSLVGDANLYNILAAVAVTQALKVPRRHVKAALKNFKGTPGRMEIIQQEPFMVCIDYAHTPDALESLYRLARSLWVREKGRLIAVFGAAGGGRDKWKRPQMGAIAEKFCNEIVLTEEDSYDEDPENIIHDIAAGLKEKNCRKIVDRRLAVREALQLARPGDAVLITGKGAEKTMRTRFGSLPWDERRVVLEELAKLSKAAK